MCKLAKNIRQSLLITHQGNSQVKDNKIDLLVQQYEQFTILEEESIDCGFARFNTIINSLKALDEGFPSMNYVRKFLRALHPKWRAKVTTIEESKDLGKKERVKSIALKAKKESGYDETSTSESDDEEYAMAVRNFKKFFRRKDQKAFIGGFWSDSENDAKDKTNNETCLMAQSLNEVTLNSSHYSDDGSSLDNDSMQIEYDSLCEISLKIINKNKILKTKRDLLEKEILELNEKIKKLERSKEVEIVCLGFDSDKASTSGTKTMSFVGSSAEKRTDGSTIKVHGSTLPGSVSRNYGEKRTELVFSPPMSSRSDFVITRKKLIHNSIDESKKPSLRPSPKSDEWIKDGGCSKHMTGNKSLFSTYKTYDGGTPQSNGVVERKNRTLQEMSRTMLIEQFIPHNFWKPSLEYFKVFGSKFFIVNTKDYLTKFDPKSYEDVFLGYSQNSKAYVVLNKHTIKVKESFNVTFDESPPPTKLSPLVDDDVGEEESIRKNNKIVNTNNEEDKSIEVDEIINIKDSKNHPLDQVIGNLNQ
nr:UBN2 domain-containing protein [Tanacetum cinerariifolium]